MDAPLNGMVAFEYDDAGQYAETGRYADGSIFLYIEDGETGSTLRLSHDQAVSLMAQIGAQLAG